jgi:EAL domain-containing protein (putative c-di-GMP-specific phosphodiesterase class I)
MYHAKREGGGYHHYESHSDVHSPEQFTLEAELRHAIDTDGLILYYQPIVDLLTGAMVGVEALVRWPHPQRGLLAPGHFIPVAEERLHDRSLVGYITSCLRNSKVSPAQVTLEITESAAMHDVQVTQQVLEELQALGLQIALDDFGTEYASLRHLKALPVNALKIDSTFVRGVGSDAGDEAIARAVLALGQGLQLEVIAEGVEHEAQRNWLIAAGCRIGQGFGLGLPSPAEQILQRCTR